MHLYPKRAALEGSETEIFKLLSYGATPEQWADWLVAPLEHAAARGKFNLVTRLLDAGASGRAGWRGNRGRTLLHAAAAGGNPDVVSALLGAGCRPDLDVVPVSSGMSPLHEAVGFCDEAVARKLILAGADVDNVSPRKMCVPLHLATREGHAGLARELLSTGASPDARDKHGYTPLHLATMYGNEQLAAVLLGNKADPDASDNEGWAPLMWASLDGHLSIAEMLLAAGAYVGKHDTNNKTSALDLAACHGQVGVMKAILGHGADVNDAFQDGSTALHTAAEGNRAGAINLLLDTGADVNTTDTSGATPLHAAVGAGCIGSMAALLGRGANPDMQRSPFEGGALHMICANQTVGAAAAVDLLLAWGASETACSGVGYPPAANLQLYGSSRECSAEEAERVSVLLASSPLDRVWRRRCLLVMLRARAERELAAHGARGDGMGDRGEFGREGAANGEVGGSRKAGKTGDGAGCSASDGNQSISGGGGRDSGAEENLATLVSRVVGLESKGVFRSIVGFL